MIPYTEDLDMPDDVADVHAARKLDIEKHDEWRKEAGMLFDYYAGHQWSDEDEASMEADERPMVTFNRFAPTIDAIKGYELNNRREVKYISRGMEDEEVAGAFSDMSSYARDGCDAEDEESEAYSDMIICGMGWTETTVVYDDNQDGDIVIPRIPPLEMRWDTASRANNLADADWVMREKWWDLAAVIERWPEHKEAVESASDGFEDETRADTIQHDATEAWKYEHDHTMFWDKANKTILVVQYQWREKVDFYIVMDPDTGEQVELSSVKYDALVNAWDMEIPHKKIRKWEYKQKMVAGRTLLEESETATPGGFSLECMTGKRDEKRAQWFGLGRQMVDPQKWANTFLSQALFSFQTASKGGVMVEEGAVEDITDFEDSWAASDSVVVVNDGAISGGRITAKEVGGYPPALDKLMQFAVTSLPACTGVNHETLGLVDREQSGSLEQERKKAALTILAPLVNSLKRYRKRQGRRLLALMASIYTPQLVQRITERQVPFWNEEDVRRYDVIVEDAPTSPNMKDDVWSVLQNILPAMLRAGVPIPPSLVRYTPLPDKVASEWAQFAESQSGPDPEQLQQQMQQMQQQLEAKDKQLATQNDKRYVAELTRQTESEKLQLEGMYQSRRLADERQAKMMEMALKAEIGEDERAVRIREMNHRYDTEMARIAQQEEAVRLQSRTNLMISREDNESDEDIATMKVQADLAQTRMVAVSHEETTNV